MSTIAICAMRRQFIMPKNANFPSIQIVLTAIIIFLMAVRYVALTQPTAPECVALPAILKSQGWYRETDIVDSCI